MKRKELILSILVFASLLITAYTLSGERCFDCTQTVFSNTSSCSIIGGSCISTRPRAGFTELWDFITDTKKNQTNTPSNCTPDCLEPQDSIPR